ncbi:MAG: ATP-binding protein [Gemmatimonadaceae bacterium]|nr:ATP-binding protein [Gemmatimonadaceae bacterium]
MDPSRARRRDSGGIAGLRRYSTLFGVALAAFGLAEVGLFALQRSTSRWADHSREVARLAQTGYALALEREEMANAFLLSGGRMVPTPGEGSPAPVDSTLDSLVVLTADNPSQMARAREIGSTFRAWDTGFAAPALAGALSPAAAANLDKPLFAPLRTAFAEFLTAEDVLHEDRVGRSRILGWLALIAMLFPSGILAALVVASGRRFAGQADQLAVQQELLEEQAVELEQQVEELETSNTELAEAAESANQARERAEHEAHGRQRNAALLDAALVSSPIGLSLLDTDLRYIRVNPAIAAITGLAPEAHVGRTLRDVNPALSRDIEAQLRQVVETDEPIQNLEMVRPGPRPEARIRYLLLNVYPMKSEAGETLGLAVAALDTTEQRELLEQFHHAQKLEAVGRLAAGIAHDFNNLLTVIRSYCDLALLEMADGAAGRDEIVQIRLAAERAAALSRQMLAMSRKQAIIPRPLAVKELVTEIEPMLLRVTGETVSLDIRCQLSVGLVHIDPTHLEQVLMNLVINAVDAMPNGGRLVIDVQDTVLDAEAVKRFVGLKPGGYVSLAVRDSGTGIDDETLRRIFDPFFTTKPQGKGTGLGLSTVYGIVRAAGGHVHVLSDVGAGTTFTVYLPVGAPRDGEPAHTTSRTAPAGPVAGGHEVVLVVEDDDLLRTSLARALRRRGFQVLEAAHGGEALRVALDHDGAIDLVLSDVHMPGMGGRDLVARLLAARPRLKALFMSGSSGENANVAGEPPSRDAFIAKPFSIDDLARQVRAALDA